jgi:hypothetical protein
LFALQVLHETAPEFYRTQNYMKVLGHFMDASLEEGGSVSRTDAHIHVFSVYDKALQDGVAAEKDILQVYHCARIQRSCHVTALVFSVPRDKMRADVSAFFETFFFCYFFSFLQFAYQSWVLLMSLRSYMPR